MTRLIWWIRRDLRLNDNAALHNALKRAESVIPVFILDDSLLKSERLNGPRAAWLFDGLRALDTDLRARGGRLILRSGNPSKVLAALAAEAGASGVCFNRDYSPYAVKRDQQVTETLRARGLQVESYADLLIHEPDEVFSASGKAYEVYTPFRRAWNGLAKPSVYRTLPQDLAKLRLPSDLVALPGLAIPVGEQPAPEPIGLPSESEAAHRLDLFLRERIFAYDTQRDFLGVEGTSVLSPYLRFGMISARTCFHAAQEAMLAAPDDESRKGVDRWIGELVWREFNYQIMARFPHIIHRNFRPAFDAIIWDDAPHLFEAWYSAKTGYPVIDAAMRQLFQTGWMHNRARMLVASFLCKDLLIDWRKGERVFMQRLLDGDAANNVGGWQWTAGTGTDAAPYFRVFNPISQSEKFDPEGAYIRRWLPELAALPNQYIHAPFTMDLATQRRYGVLLGTDYPFPVVDHSTQREKALQIYSAAKKG
ncbi:MAG: deoxyribodipyrimidine photo-lyase [Anaerolineae bacterium]